MSSRTFATASPAPTTLRGPLRTLERSNHCGSDGFLPSLLGSPVDARPFGRPPAVPEPPPTREPTPAVTEQEERLGVPPGSRHPDALHIGALAGDPPWRNAGDPRRHDLGISPDARPCPWHQSGSLSRRPLPVWERGPRHEQLRDGTADASTARSACARGLWRSPRPHRTERRSMDPAERRPVAAETRRGSHEAGWRGHVRENLATEASRA
jgi:hypothetical protein